MDRVFKYQEIDREKLYDLYVNQGYTQQQCANEFGVGLDTIRAARENYGIPTKNISSWATSKLIIPMTDEMYEVLRGALLGDGSLIISSHGVNARLSYMSKSYQHVQYIADYFSEYSYGKVTRSDRYDKRTGNTYTSYCFHSLVSPTFTEEHHKWYCDGIKHIPKDLVLTPLMCKVWYIGDGCLVRCSKTETSQKIYLCTNCFGKEEIENILLPQLQNFKPYLSKTENDGQYRITIGHKKYIKRFLEYIGECPFTDYQYKWNVIEARKGYNGETAFCDDINEWYFLYQSGLSCNTIGNMYGCTRGAVEPQIYKANIMRHVGDTKPKDYQKWNTLYPDLESVDYSEEEEYKKNAIKKYLAYIRDHHS